MTTNPTSLARAIERHVRNSHALGKLIVDGVWSRLGGGSGRGSGGGVASSTANAPSDANQSATVRGLPMAETEWVLLSSGDVVSKIAECDDATVRAIGAYEDTHRRRRLVIEAVRRRLGA